MSRVPPECERLAAELHALRRRSRLSLAALAAASPYSKSSWDRYVNGKAMPPWHAVSALCRLAGEPEPRLRALWELADSAWSGRGAVAAARSDAPAPVTAELRPASTGTPAVPPPPALPVPASPAPRPDAGPAPGTAPAGAEPAPDTDAAPLPTGEPAVPGRARRRLRVPVLAAAAASALLTCTVLVIENAHGWGGTAGPPASGAALSGSGVPADCSGTACNGRNPALVRCTQQPQSLLQTQALGAGLQIRYSPPCDAAWARVYQAQVGDTLTITAPGRPAQTVVVTESDVYQFVYTPMLALPARGAPLRACLTPPRGTARACYSVLSPARP